MIWTVPNILTFFRVLAAPGLAAAFVVFDRPAADWLALGIFFVASATDYLDGWLARRLNQMSDIGKMLDPIADKAMVMIALAMLLAMCPPEGGPLGPPVPGFLSWILVPAALILLREVMVSGLREYLGDIKLPVTRLAKWKTTVQMLAIGLVFLGYALLSTAAGRLAVTPDDPAGIVVLHPSGPALLDLSANALLGGLALLWLAGILTVLTGWDYFRKGLAYIRKQEED